MDVRLNEVGDKVDIWWSEVRGWMIQNIIISYCLQVECATGYRIHQRLDHSDTETVWVAQHGLHLYLTLDSPEPCVNYRCLLLATFIVLLASIVGP